MIKAQTVNTFEDGIIMDLEPLKVPKSSLTNALNATLLTFNDNENSLQCDMGNGRVETAYLPTGYIPMGTTSLGGIIYIVSYNPIEGRCQVGSFPSPERNITSSKTSDDIITLSNSIFVDDSNNIIRTLYKKKLYDTNLNPGDKFLVTVKKNKTTEEDPYTQISYYDSDNKLCQKWLTFELATLDSNGRLIYLNDLLKYSDNINRNFIFKIDDNNTSSDNVDTYRDIISADYNIFNAKISGKLYLIAQLDVPDKINITYKVIGKETINNEDKYKIQVICTALPTTYDHPITYNYSLNGEVLSETSKETTTTFNINIDTKKSSEIKIKPSLEIGNCTWLDTTLHIDPTLINSGKVISEEWRYYKNETYIDIKFSLDLYPYEDETVEQIKVVFIPYTEIKKVINISDSDIYANSDYYSITLPSNESYSGIQTISAIINDKLKENSLYLVKIIAQKIQTTQKTKKYNSTIHFLYTNNMYNDAYLDYDQGSIEESNFDNLKLPFNCELKLSKDTNYTITDNTKYPNLILDTQDNIQGKSEVELNGNIDLKANLTLTEDYNTFSVKPENLQFGTINTEDIKAEVSGDFKKEWDDTDAEDNELYLNSEFVTNTENTNITYRITINNPIYATTELKTIQVTNYLTPIASTLSEFINYDIYEQDGSLQYLPSFFGLGISSGGSDNKGGGGNFHIKGVIDLGVETDSESGLNKLVQYAVSLYDDNDYNAGYAKFPDNILSTAIDQMKNSAPIVPVLLTFVGGNFIRISGKDDLYYTDQNRNVSNDRKAMFQWEQASTYRYIWFFLRTNYSSTQYVPLNIGIRIAPTEGTVKIGEKQVKEYSYTDSMKAWVNILTQLYVKKQNKEEITKYSINKINYTKDIQLHISSTIPIYINSDKTTTFTPTYYIGSNKTTSLNDIYAIFKYECLRIQDINTEINKFDVNITKTIEDPLVKEFLKAQSSTPVVSTYINNPFKGKNITSVKSLQSSTSQIYAINFNTGELYIPAKGESVAIKDIDSFAENEITLKDDTFLTLTNLDLLYYDSRENNGDGRLLINKSQYDTYSRFNIQFSAGNAETKTSTVVSSATISDDLKLF